jgi:fluoride exporter
MATLFVGIGGLLGVLSRYGISRLTLHHHGLLVAGGWFSRDVREGIGVGFLGGFTTFSTFSVQIVMEADAGETGMAALYLTASVVGGIAAAAGGYVLGRAYS